MYDKNRLRLMNQITGIIEKHIYVIFEPFTAPGIIYKNRDHFELHKG